MDSVVRNALATLMFVLAAVLAFAFIADPSHSIGATEAIDLAERFIADNGYTDAVASLPIVRGSLEQGTDSEILADRRGLLLPKAYGYLRLGADWVVIFQYAVPNRLCACGRAVEVNRWGEGVHMAHQMIELAKAETILE